jgi:cell division protein FtsB
VTAVEKAAILDADDESSRDRIIEDSAGLLRMLETVLVLHEDRSGRRKELEKMKGEYLKLEAENMKLENEVVDLRGKKENFVAAAKENRELKEEVAKFDEERKKFEEEIKMLKSAMAPAEDETENTRELLSRAEIFAFLRLAPSQLHPNAMAFVLAFEHLCEYKNVVPTRALFFRVFQLQRMTKEFGRRS